MRTVPRLRHFWPILFLCGWMFFLPLACDSGDGMEGDEEMASDSEPEQAQPLRFTAVTFNSGTTEPPGGDPNPYDGYTSEHASISDEYYGDGLAWVPAVEATKAFFERVDPDIVVFQEIFYSALCPDIPEAAHTDFICESWTPGDPTVANREKGERLFETIVGNGVEFIEDLRQAFGARKREGAR